MDNFDLNNTIKKLQNIKNINPLIYKLWQSSLIVKYNSLIKTIENCDVFLKLIEENKINIRNINENNILTLTLFLNTMT